MTRDDLIILSRSGLRVVLPQPGTYYQGTRFDWSGVFRSIELGGFSYCDEWFDAPDPLRHDNVCGPSEEFYGCVGYDTASVGESFLKVGVGLLRREDDSPYDWFHRYEIVDPGKRKTVSSGDCAEFFHEMEGLYAYRKSVLLTSGNSFRIAHSLVCRQPMSLRQYCHNFFTFSLGRVGPERSVDFDGPVSGRWRDGSRNALFDGRRVWITDTMNQGQNCYLGNIRSDSRDGYGFVLKAGNRSVRVKCSRPMGTSVLWSNHRVFCPEPYIDLQPTVSTPLEWSIDYTLL